MELIELTKICTECGERKSWKEFHKIKAGLFGIGSLCKKCRAIDGKVYRKVNQEKTKARHKVYRKANREKINTYFRAYRKANPEKERIKFTKSNKKQRLKPKYMINNRISAGIRQSLKKGNGKNGYHWEDLLSYTLNDLIKRLKKTLPPGYTWNDFIKGKTNLHIDHIIPISVHNFKSYTDTDFQRCWALKNLQLLPLVKNISKGAKLTKHFQPSLLL